MLRNAIIAAALSLAPFVVGCGVSPAGEEEMTVETGEQGLTNASISASIGRAFTFFDGAKPALTEQMPSATLPRAVRTAVATARRGVFAKLAEENMTSSDVIDMNVYAVYTNSSKDTLAGYALWVHTNTGSAGAAYLVGFNSRAAVVLEKNDWYQDDQDLDQ